MAPDGKTRTRQLADRIAAAIRSGEYPQGSRLRQETLAERFEVSRTPIREALRIREAYQVRAELEGLAAELAAEWITEAQIGRLAQAEARFKRSVDALSSTKVRGGTRSRQRTWVETNEDFHDVIVEASGNRRLRS